MTETMRKPKRWIAINANTEPFSNTNVEMTVISSGVAADSLGILPTQRVEFTDENDIMGFTDDELSRFINRLRRLQAKLRKAQAQPVAQGSMG